MTTTLFGENRTRLGNKGQEWSVWVSGMDDIHDKHSLEDALELANELNAIFADLRFRSDSKYSPIMHAVVLHHGYAWTASTEHALGLDCGVPACEPCSLDRDVPSDKSAPTA
ncbi:MULTISPECIES: hypothetical protein [unclassified Streptomyces]|uniref:hypothetical protein n=1 Tax=unclassified Streptomyces TaxID=2593676 RepID=UPI00080556B2|nr:MULTISPECIES: hypothetical protein [unclassified Streptomyces]MYR73035.1 hypothetical protein [Streptomyces sp. SID4925]SBU95992.1 hypothetical protein YUMDRAFT_01648 [Streptomyces sp. OspMP-M45]